MLAAIYLFAGFVAGFALAGSLFALAARYGEEESDGCKHIWEPWGEGEISPVKERWKADWPDSCPSSNLCRLQ